MDAGRGTLMRRRDGQVQLDHSFAYHIHNPPFIAYLERQVINRGMYVRNASVHLPVVLPRRPWSHLSDHAPLAAEIHL
jgi:endonuclease/exonuclease/phosphatase family metal-dependent hydrolase